MEGPEFYPYRFNSIFKRRVWGGRDLENRLGKRLPPNELVGESWEISDREDDMSILANGPREGATLQSLLEGDRAGILGPQFARLFSDRFPLLVKYIDAQDILSL